MNETESVASPKRASAHIIILLGACVMLVACLVAFYQLKASYTGAIKGGKENTARLTNTLSGYVDLSFMAVDLMLRRASDKQYYNFLFGEHLNDDMAASFKMWIDEVPSIRAMMVTDNTGAIKRAFSKEEKGQDLLKEGGTVRDQRYFILHKMDEAAEVQVSPFAVEGDDKKFIIMSRSLTKLDGSFGGIIAALIDVESFTSILQAAEISHHTKMVMMMDDGVLLAQAPTAEMQGDFNTPRFVASLITQEDKAGALHLQEESIDENMHIVAFKRLMHLPVTVSLLVAEDDVLKNWRVSRNNYMLFLGIFALFVAVTSCLAVIIGRQVRHIEKSEKAAHLCNKNTSKFITKMNYELRTPLNTIIGYSEMIHLGYFGALNEKQKERVYDIQVCGAYLLEFVHDILEIIKGEAGKLTLAEGKTAIAPILGTVLKTVVPYAKKEGVNIVSDEGIEHLPALKADERKLRQAFLNLLNSMVKFTPSGGMLALSGEVDGKNNLVITVISRGMTRSLEDFSQAFSLAGQLDMQDTESGGLGLPLCKIFVECHGGQVKCHNAEGEGMVVRVILPAERVIFSDHE